MTNQGTLDRSASQCAPKVMNKAAVTAGSASAHSRRRILAHARRRPLTIGHIARAAAS
jgi:hypothetical protein